MAGCRVWLGVGRSQNYRLNPNRWEGTEKAESQWRLPQLVDEHGQVLHWYTVLHCTAQLHCTATLHWCTVLLHSTAQLHLTGALYCSAAIMKNTTPHHAPHRTTYHTHTTHHTALRTIPTLFDRGRKCHTGKAATSAHNVLLRGEVNAPCAPSHLHACLPWSVLESHISASPFTPIHLLSPIHPRYLVYSPRLLGWKKE